MPGERVKVSLENGREPRVMVYGGMHEVGSLGSLRLAFIEIPPHYGKSEVYHLGIWEMYLDSIRFPNGHVQCDLHKTYLKVVQNVNEEFPAIKSLIDKVNN